MAKSKKNARIAPTTALAPASRDASSRQRLAADLRVAAAALLLIAATFATYRGSLSGRLFFDDHSAIENNTNVHALVNPATRWKWSTWVRAASSDVESPLSGRPVVSLSFALNHWWASTIHPSRMPNYEGLLPAHTPFFHYVNLALHIGVALLLFALVRRTLLMPSFEGRHRTSADAWAFCLALIWAVHPLNTETVVYVTQRTEQIVSLFLLLTIYCSARSLHGRSVPWQIAAVVACLLGMASKENMIAAPLLVVAYDRAFAFDSWSVAFRSRRWFYLAIAATWGVLAYIMLQNPRGASVGFSDERLPWYEYLITQCWCLWRYFWLTVIPLGSQLCVDYGRRPVLEFQHTAPGALLVFTLLGVTAWGWVRRPWIGFLGTWFFLILAPTSSFYPIVTEIGAERRMYLPSAAILVGLVAGVVGITRLLRAQSSEEGIGGPNRLTQLGVPATVGLAILLGYTSHQRNKVYQEDLTLYGHIVAVFPDNDRGCNNFGKICMDNHLNEQALGLFNRAVKIDPEYVDAFTNRAIIFLGGDSRTHYDLAIADSTEALNWQPWGTNARNNRATAYMEAKLYDLARAEFEMLIRADPYSSNARFNQANLFLRMGDDDPKYFADAMKSIDEALAINNHSYRAYNTQGSLFVRMKRPDDGIRAFSKALEMIRLEAQHLPPESPQWENWVLIEQALQQINAGHRSIDNVFHQAAENFAHRGTMASIYNNRADAYDHIALARDNPKDKTTARTYALDDLTRAIFLDSANPRYHLFRGETYLALDRPAEAMIDLDTALKLAPDWPQALHGHLRAAIGKQEFDTAKRDAAQLRKLGFKIDPATEKLLIEHTKRTAGGA